MIFQAYIFVCVFSHCHIEIIFLDFFIYFFREQRLFVHIFLYKVFNNIFFEKRRKGKAARPGHFYVLCTSVQLRTHIVHTALVQSQVVYVLSDRRIIRSDQ